MHKTSGNDHFKGLCHVDLQQHPFVSVHVHYRPVLDHLQIPRNMTASICGGFGAREPRNEGSVTCEPRSGLHLSASCQHHLLHHSQRGFRFQGICCDRKLRFMPVFKKWVCRSSEASERSLSSKQAELSLAQQALAALQDTSALQSR